MAEAIDSRMIADELRAIRTDIEYIKQHMVNTDMILNKDEEARLEKSLKEHSEGKTVKLKDFEKKLRK
ncbi:MAG: hypothetical protein V1659_01440 [Candidatus Woesearchaeota archaeon]